MTTRRTIPALIITAGLALSGCAEPGTSSVGRPAVPPSSSPAPLPTLARPTAPPNDPTDLIKPGWLVGTVTTGGTGPCYGLTTDDGVDYALHNADGTKLTRGTRIRIRTRAALVRIYCGPGKLVEMTAMEPVG
jgi:hypothetical protein